MSTIDISNMKTFTRKQNGKTYVYTFESYWDKEKKAPRNRQKLVGHLDENGNVVPNGKPGRPRKCTPSASASAPSETEEFVEVEIASVGSDKVLTPIAEETQLKSTLQKVFPDLWKQILSCAFFLVSQNEPLSNLEVWSKSHLLPYSGSLASQRISELIRAISPADQYKFFDKWISLNQDGSGYYALDITSVSSYSKSIDLVRWGYNRDHENLPQINLLMITSEQTGLPIYFVQLNGALKDVNALDDVLNEMTLLQNAKICVIMDKGFFSKDNIDALYDHHQKFAVGIPFTAAVAKDMVKENRETIISSKNAIYIGDDIVYGVTRAAKWGKHRIYYHCFYDEVKASHDRTSFMKEIKELEQELLEGNRSSAHEKKYQKYFEIKETPVRGVSVQIRQDVVDAEMKSNSGWFIMCSNKIKDTVEALEVYRGKDPVEKCFDDLKNNLDMKRLKVHDNDALPGALFIHFIALILYKELTRKMKAAELDKKMTVKELMAEVETIMHIGKKGKRTKKKIRQTTKAQNEILEALGIKLA